jgi:citrate synthase
MYRGYTIEDLIENNVSFVEVCYLLLYGDFPTKDELSVFEERIKDEMIVHEKLLDFYKGFTVNAHPMAILCSVVGALSSFIHNTLDVHDAV